ncbi:MULTISPECIES: aldehyde dehydrogenase family protein [unclassified Bradyrhizobium]|uniref:aldehyde dehydrogenase family protein n=1 Tax=unclassified Bradyrhizobium TaxID=2631580 RepID=UPI0028E62448|nr:MULTISPECIES: aldehyde dehydrogenase family protein [unclassified Bradyrhizobium]
MGTGSRDVSNEAELAHTEPFSPIRPPPLVRAANEAEAPHMAGGTEFGLSSAVFTEDAARDLRFAQGAEAGITHIDDISPSDDPNTKFGGKKNSGRCRFNSDWITQDLTSDDGISVQQEPRAYPF